MRRNWRAGIGGLVVLLFVGVLTSAEAEAQEAVAGEFDRLVELIEGDADMVEKLAAAHQLGELRPYLVPAEYSERLELAAQNSEEPLVQFMVRRRAARADLERGVTDVQGDNQGFARAQSCLVDWELVGPFENSSMQGFEERFGPETGAEGPYTGRLTEVDWRDVSRGHHLCAYQLNSRVHPSTSAVVYLGTTVEVDAGGPAKLLVGSRGPYRIWVNGEPVGGRSEDLGLGVDSEGWSVDLEAGENEILVKLASTGQGGLSWVARLVDDADMPLQNWTARGGVDAQAVASFEGFEEPVGGAKSAILEGIEPGTDPSTRLAAAVLWKTLYSEDASTPWRDEADQLNENLDELTPRQIVWLAELFEEHWRRQAILDTAVERGDGDRYVELWRAVERGRTVSRTAWETKRRELRSLVEESPGFLMATEALSRWFLEHEGPARALRTIESWEHEHREETPAWVRLAADLHEEMGDGSRAAELRRKTTDVYQLTGAYGWRLIREAMAAGRLEEALRMARDYQERAPWSQAWARQEAMLLRASGESEEALAVVDALIEEAPGDASLRERRAELMLNMGNLDGAMRSIEEAIVLQPQARRFQEYLDHLQPESTRFYEAWVVDELRELAEETDVGSQDYDILVDQRVQQVSSNGLARRFEQQARRVSRNEGVNRARQLRLSYRPGDERIEVLSVRVLKADGTISEDYDDWTTSRTRQSARMYNDRGYMNMRANNVDVGDIVEFRYVIHQVANENFRGDYFGDVRYVQRTNPVALARYAVLYPDDWELYFRDPEMEHQKWTGTYPDGEPVEDGQQVTGFELRDVPRVYTESDQPGHTDVYDYIMVSNKETYDEIGKWWWELIEEQLVVDDVIRDTVAEITADATTSAEKVEVIYDYVVRNTRYLHLGLGIHGWKPYRTSTVMRNRYGDCKDKAALLKVMLEEAGVDAEMVLVRTRRLGAVDDLPASMHLFNHAVTYVPELDRFLDATARFNGPYELTQMDQGAQALVVRDGGETDWVRMPVDNAEDNLLRQELEVDLRGDVPVVTGRIEAHGANAVNYRRQFEDAERRDERFEDQIGSTFPGAELVDVEYENLDDLMAPTKIRFSARVPGVLRGSQGSQSVYPFMARRDLLGRHARTSDRLQDMTFRVPFANEAEVRYRLPSGLALERIPEASLVVSPFGQMEMNYRRDDSDELVVDIRYTIGVQRVSVEDYPEFRQFIAEMDEAINETIRLIDEAGAQ